MLTWHAQKVKNKKHDKGTPFEYDFRITEVNMRKSGRAPGDENGFRLESHDPNSTQSQWTNHGDFDYLAEAKNAAAELVGQNPRDIDKYWKPEDDSSSSTTD